VLQREDRVHAEAYLEAIHEGYKARS
jgi:hypothetical protein